MADFFRRFFSTSHSDAFKNGAPYLFSTPHIVFIALAAVSITLISIFLRKIPHKKLKTVFICFFAYNAVMEVVKITWESVANRSFFFGGIMPLYLCSMYMFFMPFAIWSKNGFLKKCACGFLCSLGILGGLINFFIPPILNDYPVFSFAGLHSLIYHYIMVLTGIWMLASKYYRPKPAGFLSAFVPTAIFSIPVIIADKIWGFNYMQYNTGAGTPFEIISKHIPSDWLWTLVMLALYFVATFLFFIPVIFKHLLKKTKASPAQSE